MDEPTELLYGAQGECDEGVSGSSSLTDETLSVSCTGLNRRRCKSFVFGIESDAERDGKGEA